MQRLKNLHLIVRNVEVRYNNKIKITGIYDVSYSF